MKNDNAVTFLLPQKSTPAPCRLCGSKPLTKGTNPDGGIVGDVLSGGD